MQKHFAVVTGITMFAVAGVVISQAGIFSSSTQGQIVSTGYTSTYSAGNSASISSSADQFECQYHIVEGIVEECCREPYSVYYTCRHYSDRANRLCQEYGIQCRSLDVFCPNLSTGHRVNIAIIDGRECLIDPTAGIIISCDIDTPEKYQAAICTVMGKPPDCNCSTRSVGSSVIPYDYTVCALNRGLRGPACEECCESEAEYHSSRGDPLVPDWIEECKSTCRIFSSASSCARARNCRAGYIGSCEPHGCHQPYNTGGCSYNGMHCLVIDRTCENSAVTCDRNYSRSQSTENDVFDSGEE
jgi:hypothetical protein